MTFESFLIGLANATGIDISIDRPRSGFIAFDFHSGASAGKGQVNIWYGCGGLLAFEFTPPNRERSALVLRNLGISACFEEYVHISFSETPCRDMGAPSGNIIVEDVANPVKAFVNLDGGEKIQIDAQALLSTYDLFEKNSYIRLGRSVGV